MRIFNEWMIIFMSVALFFILKTINERHNNSCKIDADIFIDDKGIATPLNIKGETNWIEIRKLLRKRGLIE